MHMAKEFFSILKEFRVGKADDFVYQMFFFVLVQYLHVWFSTLTCLLYNCLSRQMYYAPLHGMSIGSIIKTNHSHSKKYQHTLCESPEILQLTGQNRSPNI